MFVFLSEPCMWKPCKNNGVCIDTETPPGFKCNCKKRPSLMEVREEDCAEDVAFRKGCLQSTTYGHPYGPNKAVDGYSFTHSSTSLGKGPAQWWRVDFKSLKVIDDVKIELNAYPSASGYTVSMSNTSDFHVSQHCYTIKVDQHSRRDVSLKCSVSVVAQFMKIQLRSDEARIALYKVIVFGWDV